MGITVSETNGNGAKALFKHWQFFACVFGIVAAFTRMETKVQAMEPVQSQVAEMKTEQAVMKTDITYIKESVEKLEKKTEKDKEEILDAIRSIDRGSNNE